MPWRPQDRSPAYNRGWKQARERCLREANWRCQIRGPGCAGVAVTVDHIYGIDADPGHKHLQAACKPCHDAKTKGEARRGRAARGKNGGDPDVQQRTVW